MTGTIMKRMRFVIYPIETGGMPDFHIEQWWDGRHTESPQERVIEVQMNIPFDFCDPLVVTTELKTQIDQALTAFVEEMTNAD